MPSALSAETAKASLAQSTPSLGRSILAGSALALLWFILSLANDGAVVFRVGGAFGDEEEYAGALSHMQFFPVPIAVRAGQ